MKVATGFYSVEPHLLSRAPEGRCPLSHCSLSNGPMIRIQCFRYIFVLVVLTYIILAFYIYTSLFTLVIKKTLNATQQTAAQWLNEP